MTIIKEDIIDPSGGKLTLTHNHCDYEINLHNAKTGYRIGTIWKTKSLDEAKTIYQKFIAAQLT